MSNQGNFKLDFVFIGFARAGTSWVYHQLREHPQICVPQRDELYYFCSSPLWGSFCNRDRGEAWFRSMFQHAKPGQVVGERTTIYVSEPTCPALLKAAYPDVKILIAYRNPVDRLYSFYHMLCMLYPMPDTFEEFLKQHPQYIETGYYATLTQRFLDHFPKEQFHFIFFNDIIHDPRRTMAECYDFLGVDTDFEPSGLFGRINESRAPASLLYRNIVGSSVQFLKSRAWGYSLYNALNRLNLYSLLQPVSSKFTKKKEFPPMAAATREFLVGAYREENRRLGAMLQRDVSHWDEVSEMEC